MWDSLSAQGGQITGWTGSNATGAAGIYVASSNYYSFDYSIVATGVPSGAYMVTEMRLASLGNYSQGSGAP